jgi:hypothetical protein
MIKKHSPLITKLWVVSVVIEPFLFFVIADRTQIGFGMNIGRIFQAIVINWLFFEFLIRKSFIISSEGLYLITPYSYGIIYIYFATFFSIIFGVHPTTTYVSDSKNLLDHLNNFTVRPVIEGLIVIYQFFYFVILPLLLLKKKTDFDFFFKVLFFFLILHFGMGYLDFLLNMGGIQLIPRHLHEEIHVGLRWHGIAGEPRDAAVYNMSLFFILAVYSIYTNGRITRINPLFYALLLLSLLLTFSASFVVGVFISAGLVLIFYFSVIKFKKIKYIMFAIGFLSIFIAMNMKSDRVVEYYEAYSEFLLQLYLNPNAEMSYLIKNSFNNVYPIIFLSNDFLLNLNVYPLLFGYGIGASGVVNQNIYEEFYNPNNQLVRTIFEYGIIGTGLLIFGIKKLLKRGSYFLDLESKNHLLLVTLIMMGGVLAHRSNVWLIWLGIFCAVSSYQNRLNSTRSIN